jgi:hypothetical protein
VVTDRSGVPSVWYNIDAQQHRYYPDIYIPAERRLIEVKSMYTLEQGWDKIRITRQACMLAGYSYQLWVLDQNGARVNTGTF